MLSVFVVRAQLDGESVSEAKEHAAFYVRGREASTISSYNSKYKKVVEFYKESGKMFIFDERDAMAFIVWRFKLGVSEMQMKQAMAVFNLMCEVCGVESPSKSLLVVKVKMAAIKEANGSKKKKIEWIGMTKDTLENIMKVCYRSDAKKVIPERRRFLLMKIFCFLGVKRFDDIQKIKRKDVVFRQDDRVKVWLARTKTDSEKRGSEFVLTKGKIDGVSVTSLVKWYFRSLGEVPDEAFIFPLFRRGEPVWDRPVSYNAARLQLIKERETLDLGRVSWHSGRIGAASEAARKKVSRNVIMRSGGWRSSAVDTYMRVVDAGVIVGDAVL